MASSNEGQTKDNFVQKYNVGHQSFTKFTFQSRQSGPFEVNLEGPTAPSMKREG
jgi:hypothetical protein